MANLCECVVEISTYLPIFLIEIIQEYAHNMVQEPSYRKSYDNFKFRVRLDKKLNSVEELNAGCDLDKTPELQDVNPFYLNIFGMKDIRGNPCRWLEIDFLVNKKKYFFSTSLTSSVKCSPNKLISGGKHSCRTLHKKLLKYFGKGHQDALLAEIIQRCQITPIKEDYESIWSFIHEKVTAKISSTNLWTEIHC